MSDDSPPTKSRLPLLTGIGAEEPVSRPAAFIAATLVGAQ